MNRIVRQLVNPISTKITGVWCRSSVRRAILWRDDVGSDDMLDHEVDRAIVQVPLQPLRGGASLGAGNRH